MSSPKEQFLSTYDREHAITMKVLKAYPPDKAELRPHPKCKTARELAWIFVVERGMGTMALKNAFAQGMPEGGMPPALATIGEVITAYEKAHQDFRTVVSNTPDDQLLETVKFFTAPKTLGDVRRIDFLWFMLSDEIHHRGQFSIYLRMADGRVPSIYGPSADEPWM
jgi:uncharacterized damage-inducible protein DinB